ncbi:MAG: HEAT repeat domain-containing protein [Planctomycetota bacterium]
MSRSSVVAGMLIGCLLTAPPVVRADLFLLTSGGQVEGELVNRLETPRQSYIIQLPSGGQLTLDKQAVANVVVRSEAERRYQELLPKMPRSVDGHWKMAEWCKERGLDAQRQEHLREIIKLEPDHEVARNLLGYSRKQGKWMTTEDFFRSQGYIRYGSSWRLPQEIALLSLQEQAKQVEVEWRQKLRILRSKVDRKNGERALDEIRAIQDPNASGPLVAMFEDKNERRELKLIYIELLGRLNTGAAIGALVKHAIQDDDQGIRERCLDQLERIKSEQITIALCRLLRDENNVVVQRAAVALGRFQDPSATLPLIDALVTKHKQVVSSGGGAGSISPTFSADGGGGLSMGGGPKVIQNNVNNEPVLTALQTLHPNVNFGFDEVAWRRWYGEQRSPTVDNLRRDP